MAVTGQAASNGCATRLVGVVAGHSTLRFAFVVLLRFTAVQALYSSQHLEQFLENETDALEREEANRAGDAINKLDEQIGQDASLNKINKQAEEAERDLEKFENDAKTSVANANGGPFGTLSESTKPLQDAVAKLHEVTADSKHMAHTAYQDIGEYDNAVQALKQPMDEMTQTASTLHATLKKTWNETERDRLKPLSDLQS
eukprot:CAMPEP_0172720068 /NCGR_PEP_ID=MMETSP1074-20121228/76062_1 /TAXON_ID=2916 /ORGANISM="Ceratium fusus, Strain PA161109" /LENGTH=200 /DNA_ID=CAMNT_0013545505 /DNA_START=82 /DNA_END=680 /DNA_ORIENTATION=+